MDKKLKDLIEELDTFDASESAEECECELNNYYVCLICKNAVCKMCCNKIHTPQEPECTAKPIKISVLNKYVAEHVKNSLSDFDCMIDNAEWELEHINPVLDVFKEGKRTLWFEDEMGIQVQGCLPQIERDPCSHKERAQKIYKQHLSAACIVAGKLYTAPRKNVPKLLKTIARLICIKLHVGDICGSTL